MLRFNQKGIILLSILYLIATIGTFVNGIKDTDEEGNKSIDSKNKDSSNGIVTSDCSSLKAISLDELPPAGVLKFYLSHYYYSPQYKQPENTGYDDLSVNSTCSLFNHPEKECGQTILALWFGQDRTANIVIESVNISSSDVSYSAVVGRWKLEETQQTAVYNQSLLFFGSISSCGTLNVLPKIPNFILRNEHRAFGIVAIGKSYEYIVIESCCKHIAFILINANATVPSHSGSTGMGSDTGDEDTDKDKTKKDTIKENTTADTDKDKTKEEPDKNKSTTNSDCSADFPYTDVITEALVKNELKFEDFKPIANYMKWDLQCDALVPVTCPLSSGGGGGGGGRGEGGYGYAYSDKPKEEEEDDK